VHVPPRRALVRTRFSSGVTLKVPPLVPVSKDHRLPTGLCRPHQRRLLFAQSFPLANHQRPRCRVKRNAYGTEAIDPKGTLLAGAAAAGFAPPRGGTNGGL
jgi:hypothetical protein